LVSSAGDTTDAEYRLLPRRGLLECPLGLSTLACVFESGGLVARLLLEV